MGKNDEKNILDTMKEEYRQIPVPDEARERIKEGIRRAKLEESGMEQEEKVRELKEIRKNKGNWRLIMKRSGMTAAAALIAITLLANVNPTIAQAMEQIPVIGSIARVVTFRTFENKTNHFEAKIDVPQVEGESSSEIAANKSIEEYANQLIAQYEADLRESGGQGNYSMQSTYDVAAENEKYLSLRIRTTLAMASGDDMVRIFTIDKASGNVITLKEILAGKDNALEKVSENIKEQMKAQMAADENVVYFLDSEEPEWDFKGLTGDESYYINQKGELVIAFSEYDVAPGYMGAVEFTIPQSVTGGF